MVAIARGFHLLPFRTEKLSPSAPMVLLWWESRSLPVNIKALLFSQQGFFYALSNHS